MARVRRQAAVIPYRIRKARLEVALVTTSKGHGWIVPKGCIDEGERARDAAIREAEEERACAESSSGGGSAGIATSTATGPAWLMST